MLLIIAQHIGHNCLLSRKQFYVYLFLNYTKAAGFLKSGGFCIDFLSQLVTILAFKCGYNRFAYEAHKGGFV